MGTICSCWTFAIETCMGVRCPQAECLHTNDSTLTMPLWFVTTTLRMRLVPLTLNYYPEHYSIALSPRCHPNLQRSVKICLLCSRCLVQPQRCHHATLNLGDTVAVSIQRGTVKTERLQIYQRAVEFMVQDIITGRKSFIRRKSPWSTPCKKC